MEVMWCHVNESLKDDQEVGVLNVFRTVRNVPKNQHCNYSSFSR